MDLRRASNKPAERVRAGVTQPSDGAGVFISKITDDVRWIRVTKLPGAVDGQVAAGR